MSALRKGLGLGALLLALAPPAEGAPPPPAGARAFDTPNDGGRSITIEWTPPRGAEAPGPDGAVPRMRVERDSADSWILVGQPALAAGVFVDSGSSTASAPPNGTAESYRLVAFDASGNASPIAVGPAQASSQWFHRERWNVFLLLMTLASFVLINIVRANRGTTFQVRRLTPVDAMDEAIGRATEMGRPVLYVPGIEEVEDIQTIASMLILERVAEKTAAYDVKLHVPTRTPFVLAVADEVVKTGCSAAGRPDAYRPDQVRFISAEQFAYCAGVNGIILREKPAANFYLGRFFAESLIFAETGFSAGSIQIAGTAEVTQLPFFIAACDYTLIGEEFFAASAYLSGDRALLSTLKAADWAKIFLITLLLIGAVLETLGQSAFREWFLVR